MRWIALAAVAACTGVQPRFPSDVQTSLAHDDMRKLETERFIIYYPAARRALVDRFLVKADRCAQELRAQALIQSDRKFVIVMPDSAFNNAFVAPGVLGYEEVSVIPTFATLDFATSFGLPPDPGYIACHELVHYVHVQQTAGFWAGFNQVFGHAYTPQVGFDPWFFEGLATHYEARLVPGLGRPVWPTFTGMFAAAYAGKSIGGGDLSAFARSAPVGHHYLVGSMFVRFLAERYGERPLWVTIAAQARNFTGWFFTGTFDSGFGVSFGDLLDEFERWVQRTYPARPRPATQRKLAVLGNDARYARARDGSEAWIADDVDAPTRLTIRDARGTTLHEQSLVEILPGRTLVVADPILISGMSFTADGNELWLTAIDQGATFQTTRLLRWRRDDGSLDEITTGLGPGATIDPTGRTYYYCAVDGDRWSLAAWDVQARTRRTLVDVPPGTFVLGAQISPDGKRLAASVWDGSAFVIWIVDATTGAVVDRAGGTTAVYDPSFTSDGRLMWLGAVNGRFQVFVAGEQASDAPYTTLGAREANGTIRFLDREGWNWELAEIATPPIPPPPAPPEPAPATADAPPTETTPTVVMEPAASTARSASVAISPSTTMVPPSATVVIQSDEEASAWDHFFFPQIRTPTLAIGGGLPHIGLALGGGDRMHLHRWSLAGYMQPNPESVSPRMHWGAYAGYLNSMLAPVSIIVEGGFLDWASPVATEDPTDDPMLTVTEERRTRDAALLAAYTWRGSLSVQAGGVYTDDHAQLDVEPPTRAYVGGPSVQVAWVGSESTRYTGPRRAFGVAAQGAYYPRQLSSFMGDISDVGGTVAAIVPIPIGRRHTLQATVRGRALIARDDTDLLQLGGESALGIVWNRRSVSAEPPEFDLARFPPNLRFVEPLRGYEDYAITTEHARLAELAWKYPLIIDSGIASTWFLPATFLRQIDLELFGAGALDDTNEPHYAVGGALTLRIQLLRLPLAIHYQLARRLVDDKALTQFVGVGADL